MPKPVTIGNEIWFSSMPPERAYDAQGIFGGLRFARDEKNRRRTYRARTFDDSQRSRPKARRTIFAGRGERQARFQVLKFARKVKNPR